MAHGGFGMRNGSLDHARLIAAGGIVVFHSGAPGAAIGYAGLPFFLMLLILLAWPAAERQPFGAFAGARAGRLLAPWAIWSGVYGALKLAEVAAGHPFAAEFAPWMALTGPALHLWFLPFAAVACAALWPLARATARLSPAARTVLAVVAVAMALGAVLVQQGADLPRPFAQWAEAAPAVALGLGLALLRGAKAATAALIAGTAGMLLATGWPQGATQLALAGAALWLCLMLPLPDTRAARLSATLALTVYLAHPMVAAVLMRATPLPDQSAGLALATVAVTLAFALALHLAGHLGRQAVAQLRARPATA